MTGAIDPRLCLLADLRVDIEASRSTLAELVERRDDLVVQCYQDGLNTREIAEACGLRDPNVYQTLRRRNIPANRRS